MGDTSVEGAAGEKKSGNEGDAESQLQALEEKARKTQEALEKEEKLRKELEEQNSKLVTERDALQRQLDGEKGSLSEYMEKSLKLAAQKADLESQLQVRSLFFLSLQIRIFREKRNRIYAFFSHNDRPVSNRKVVQLARIYR